MMFDQILFLSLLYEHNSYVSVFITRTMSIFAELKSKLDQAITGVNRYNPNNVDTLESCIEAMVQENQYDKDILVTTLKLYQLNPDKFVCF